MPLQESGPISLGDVRTELGNTGIISLNDADVRSLAGRPSGVISMSNFYGAADDIAIGGVVRDYGIYRSHTFTSSGTFTVLIPTAMDWMIVAAGGPGGGSVTGGIRGGGGGAGELYLLSGSPAIGGHTVQVGVARTGAYNLDSSSYSTFQGIIALSGGPGGEGNTVADSFAKGLPGGSGGGSGSRANLIDGGIAISNNANLGHGFAGGRNTANAGGGGGGAGGVGFGGNGITAGAGGTGLLNNYSTGADIMYSHGGRGHANNLPTAAASQPGNGADAPNQAVQAPVPLGNAGTVVIRYIR
jgi:hypothetical protein